MSKAKTSHNMVVEIKFHTDKLYSLRCIYYWWNKI